MLIVGWPVAALYVQPRRRPPLIPSISSAHLRQSERFKFGGELVAGWSHDGAQAALGFEKRAASDGDPQRQRRVSDRVRTTCRSTRSARPKSRPACGEKDFFFPNDPTCSPPGTIVKCDQEDGLKRVDTYNTFRSTTSRSRVSSARATSTGACRIRSRCAAAGSSCRSVRATRSRRHHRQGHVAHHAPQCRGELRRHARVIGAPRRSAGLRSRRDGGPRRRQPRKGLRLVLLRQHLARHQQRRHRRRLGARQPIKALDLRVAYKTRFHRLEG